MSRALTTFTLAAIAAVLAVAVALELTTDVGEADSGARARGEHATALATPAARAAAAAAERGDYAAAILARPLFAANRRPPMAVAVVMGETPRDNSLPRLAGIVIEGPARFAIFQPANAGKPVSLGEGGEIGGRKVVTIAPLEVTLLGPEGEVRLHPFPANPSERPMTMATPTSAAPNVPPADPKRRFNIPHRVVTPKPPGRRPSPSANRNEP